MHPGRATPTLLWPALCVTLALLGCAESTPQVARSLLSDLDLARLGPATDPAERRAPLDRLERVQRDDLGLSALSLGAGERVELALPRDGSAARVELELAWRSSSELRLRVDTGSFDGARTELLAETLPPDPEGTQGWRSREIELPDSLRRGVVWLGIEVAGDDAGSRIALGRLRLAPAAERPAGPDLLVVCGTAAPDSSVSEPRGLVFDDCWAQSDGGDVALASLLTGQVPSVHGRDAARSLATDALGRAPGLTTLGTELRDAGYLTTLVLEDELASRLGGIDLGFETQRGTPPGSALDTALALLREPSDAGRCVLVLVDGSSTAIELPAAVERALLCDLPPWSDGPLLSLDAQPLVSLALRAPDLAAGTDTAPRMLIDVMPTLLGLAGLDPPTLDEGQPLLTRSAPDAWRASDVDPGRLLWAESRSGTALYATGDRLGLWRPGDGPGSVTTRPRSVPEAAPSSADPEHAGAIRARVDALRRVGQLLDPRDADDD